MASNKAEKNTKDQIEGKKTEEIPKTRFDLGQIKIFAGEVKTEFTKVAWPDKKHTFATTGIVVVLVCMVSFYLGAVDLILGKLIGLIIK
ncbi:MAG: preprotein translocase subunit SecE [Thermodesulfobacteriota bacterium]